MLKVLLENGLSNVLVVVTRYFGGILLGTGGLTRAYSKATQEALKKCTKVKKTSGYELKVVLDYAHIDAFKHYLEKNNILITNIEYLEKIEVTIEAIKPIFEDLTNNKKNKNFKIEKCELKKEKIVEI